jgi:hypothetical protein
MPRLLWRFWGGGGFLRARYPCSPHDTERLRCLTPPSSAGSFTVHVTLPRPGANLERRSPRETDQHRDSSHACWGRVSIVTLVVVHGGRVLPLTPPRWFLQKGGVLSYVGTSKQGTGKPKASRKASLRAQGQGFCVQDSKDKSTRDRPAPRCLPRLLGVGRQCHPS